jgi:hypothetical protein
LRTFDLNDSAGAPLIAIPFTVPGLWISRRPSALVADPRRSPCLARGYGRRLMGCHPACSEACMLPILVRFL